ncbi:MAG TPA: hypothetical protein VFX16_16980 [Pseudonocardiaceae bacterium]|nr:hypothetical protein [Pseudonocardiaceae bacterium]
MGEPVSVESDHELLRQLNSINQSLAKSSKVLAELLLRSMSQPGISHVTTTELRSVGRRLVSSGGDLTDLGVRMGIAADQLDQSSEPQQ